MDNSFKASAGHLVPEFLTVLLSGFLAFLVRESRIEVGKVTIFPETAVGATLNVAVIVLLLGLTGTAMYLMVKFRLKYVAKSLVGIAFFVMILFLLEWYLELYPQLAGRMQIFHYLAWPGLLVLIATALLLCVYKIHGLAQVGVVIFVGAMTGTFLAASIPILTTIMLLVAMMAYDVFAVFVGPIGKIAKGGSLEEFRGAILTYRDLTVGMGDIVFYSMLTSTSLINFGLIPFLAASTGVITGVFVGFKMLETREVFPGLPLALLLGLMCLIGALGLKQVLVWLP